MAEQVQYYGTGRRKTAIARVYLRPGTGEFKVNGRPFEEYFVTPSQRSSARQPLVSTESASTFNVAATVDGGGVNGQADAVKLVVVKDQGHNYWQGFFRCQELVDFAIAHAR